jgi:GT2 family glycosyltransferase
VVTIVIAVQDGLGATLQCLQSIADVWFEAASVEILVMDDRSTDGTSAALAGIPVISYVRRSERSGLAAARNDGARRARGQYVCFLNNTVTVTPGWLERLVETAESDTAVGIVAPKVLFPDGRLREAGLVVWADGSLSRYGRGDLASDPRFAFVRGADAFSDACVLVRRSVFEQLGGFDEQFTHADYDCADLCLGLRSSGYRAVYEPASSVIEYHDVASGCEDAVEFDSLVKSNRLKFCAKWSALLMRQFEPDPKALHRAALSRNGGETLLFVDSSVPTDRDARGKRLIGVLESLRRARYNVVFLADDYAAPQPYTGRLQRLGIEVLHQTQGGLAPQQLLETVLPSLDAAWVCRRNLFEHYAPIIRLNRVTKLLYDNTRDRYDGADTSIASLAADAVIVNSAAELRALRAEAHVPAFVVPQIHETAAGCAKFGSAARLLFIGNFGYAPNVDAVKWLCSEIMPRVWEELPNVHVTLAGDVPPDTVRALTSERVDVPGYVQDTAPFFYKSQAFVAPLRLGAGMRGKVGEALSHRLPCVLTSTAAEGFDMAPEQNCLIADDADAFAAAIVRLFVEPKTWERLSACSDHVLKPLSSNNLSSLLATALRQVLNSGFAPQTVSA